ncbi:MAG: nascent polypeptide-associated complex protein [Candidatus Bathycorpusculaceae bacterium]
MLQSRLDADVWRKVKYKRYGLTINDGEKFMRRRISPREAKRMMQRIGLSMDAVPDVEQVIIKTSSKEIIIEEPEVAVIDVQGQKMFQVTGGKMTEKAVERRLAIPEEDVRLVADQTGKSLEEARKALEECEGDLAKAILLLQSKV